MYIGKIEAEFKKRQKQRALVCNACICAMNSKNLKKTKQYFELVQCKFVPIVILIIPTLFQRSLWQAYQTETDVSLICNL
jgi:hypothetical protein